MRAPATVLFVALAASGCCGRAVECPPHDVLLVVSADGEAVAVEVAGYEFACEQGEEATLCRPAVDIADGDYELVVHADGYAPAPVTLSVRTLRPPPFSCECRIPSGSATLELGDTDTDTDAGTPDPDAGVPDAGASDGG